ncbi:hypothetical protein CMI37_15770 [Candidatus Pacearchaeota archaeon]|nr:hypothetical protein [Candidatus Pacearchaeota archaeon]|tara:strand:- start:1423 stop:1680 length:258 start_codon:yes stop_codon:yes gene_type:complete
MALSEHSEIGNITILRDGQIQVRTDTVIMRDDLEISRTYHRHVVSPGQLSSTQNKRVADVMNAVHTPEVIQAFKDAQEAAKSNSE